MYRYRIIEDGKVICEGTRHHVCAKIHRSKTTNLNEYATLKRKICGKYDVEVILEDDEETKRENEILDNQVFHLKLKEKTVGFPDVERNIRLLEERGIKTRKIETTEEDGKKNYLLEAI